MPEITSIKPQKNGKRLNIYLDNKFGFGIDIENFVVLGLKEGQEYPQEEINNVIKKAQFQKTLDKLLRFATLRPRSQREIKSWLTQKFIKFLFWLLKTINDSIPTSIGGERDWNELYW